MSEEISLEKKFDNEIKTRVLKTIHNTSPYNPMYFRSIFWGFYYDIYYYQSNSFSITIRAMCKIILSEEGRISVTLNPKRHKFLLPYTEDTYSIEYFRDDVFSFREAAIKVGNRLANNQCFSLFVSDSQEQLRIRKQLKELPKNILDMKLEKYVSGFRDIVTKTKFYQ